MILAKFNGKIITGAEFSHLEISNENMCADGRESYATCPDNGYRVTHISESSDGRVPHFRYCPGTPEYGRVGQTEEHKKLVQESIAASEVTRLLSDVTVSDTLIETGGHAAPISDKNERQRDVQLEFEDRDAQLGEGLIIEVQVENKSKDKHLTTADYLAEDSGYSVLWLSDDDFDTAAEEPRNWSIKFQTGEDIRQIIKRQLWPLNNKKSIWRIEDQKTLPDDVNNLIQRVDHSKSLGQGRQAVEINDKHVKIFVNTGSITPVEMSARHDGQTPGETERRGRIRGKVRGNPAVSTSELDQHFGWAPGVVAHDLTELNDDGILTNKSNSTSDGEWWFADDVGA